MKNISKYFFVIILLGVTFFSNAQTVFAPAGSEWYNEMYFGCFHSYYAGDTIIVGTNCRKIVREAETRLSWTSLGFYVYNEPPLYLYNNNDTVFVYNSIFNRFTPLYIFNVHTGDTIKLPILPPEGGDFLMPEHSDSFFSVVIDSVKMVLYDTALLKTIYSRRILHPMDSGYMFSYSLDTNGIYAEKIGSLKTGLMPKCLSCGNILDDRAQSEGILRCYSDPILSLKLTTDTMCGIPVSVKQSSISKQISLYPNPTSDILNISVKFSDDILNFSIINIQGVELINGKLSKYTNNIDVSSLSNGIYIVYLQTTNSLPVYKYFSVVK